MSKVGGCQRVESETPHCKTYFTHYFSRRPQAEKAKKLNSGREIPVID